MPSFDSPNPIHPHYSSPYEYKKDPLITNPKNRQIKRLFTMIWGSHSGDSYRMVTKSYRILKSTNKVRRVEGSLQVVEEQ